MNDAFYIGATGMQAQQLNVDTIANNLANVNTVGYKKSRVSFSGLLAHLMRSEAQSKAQSEAQSETQPGTPSGLGAGVGIASLARLFDIGEFKKTGSTFDVAIQGDGFLEVAMPDGSRAYTRGGALKIDRDGQLSTQAGHPLKPGITIPGNAQNFTITDDGRVQINVAGQPNAVEIGQLELVRFANPGMLTVLGDNVYRANEMSGEPISGRLGEDGMGTIAQGTLESSNVNLVEEMINLMMAQRAYGMNVKVVQASDEISAMVNNLRK